MAGFSCTHLIKIRAEANEYYTVGSADHFRHWHDFARHNLYGIEINDEIARVAKMNMILHDDGHTNVIGADALNDLEKIRRETENNGFSEGHFDLVLTNPPFGASFTLAERPYIATYDLGNVTDMKERKKPRNNQKTEILFIERVCQFLKPNIGRAAIVLPDSVLTNLTLQYVRNYLLKHFQILAIISFPHTAFTHYGAGVKSSILFLRKRAINEIPDDNESIFMAMPVYIGYDATGRKTQNNLPKIVQHYRSYVKDAITFLNLNSNEVDKILCFALSSQMIESRLDCQFYHPKHYEIEQRIANSGYPVFRIGDPEISLNIVDGPFGSQLKVEDYQETGVPLVRVSNCRTGEILQDGELIYITEQKHAQLSRSEVLPGDVLLTKAGHILGYAAVFPKELIKGNITSHLASIRPSPNVMPEFLAIYLSSSLGKSQIYRWGNKATRPELNTDEVRQIKFPLPPLHVQQTIVEEVQLQRAEAKRLELQAEKTLTAARIGFERSLLLEEA